MLTPFGGVAPVSDPVTAQLIHDLSWGALDFMIILSMIAAWVSPLVTLKTQNLSIQSNLPSLFVLYLLGSGISVSNTIEAIKALLTNRIWEFKRTPKYASLNSKAGWQNRRYQIPLDLEFVLEVAAVCLGVAAVIFAVRQGQYGVLLLLIPYTIAYAFIGVYTLKESRPTATS